MVVQYTLPMLFYDCIQRTYKFIDWKDIRNKSDIDESNNQRQRRRFGVRRARSLSTLQQQQYGSTDTNDNDSNADSSSSPSKQQQQQQNLNSLSLARRQTHFSDECDYDDNVSATEEASELDSDDEDEALFREWEAKMMTKQKLLPILSTPSCPSSELATNTTRGRNVSSNSVDIENLDEYQPKKFRQISNEVHRLDSRSSLINGVDSSANDLSDHGDDNSSQSSSTIPTNARLPQIPFVPFVSLDIDWGSIGRKKCEDDVCDCDREDVDSRDDDDNNLRSPVDIPSSKAGEISWLTQPNRRHRQDQTSPCRLIPCEQSEPPAGAAAMSNSKLRIPIPSHISFVQSVPPSKYHAEQCVDDSSLRDDRCNSSTSKPANMKKFDMRQSSQLTATTCSSDQSNVCPDVQQYALSTYECALSKDYCNRSQSYDSMDEIFDPTEPLIHGSISSFMHHSLSVVSEQLFQFLSEMNYLLPSANQCSSTFKGCESKGNFVYLEEVACELIKKHPIVCQVRYLIPGYRGPCLPLSYFCSIGSIRGMKTAYDAYPESIGYSDLYVGTPLHYALLYRGDYLELIQNILRLFPEAVRLTNHHQERQTPLHFACTLIHAKYDTHQMYGQNDDGSMGQRLRIPTQTVINLLLQYYPNAVQTQDDLFGMTPVHAICKYSVHSHQRPDELMILDILQSFIKTSPMAVHAVTTDTQKPLHIAAASGAPTSVLKFLHRYDPSQIKFTDDQFQTPLHKAILAAGSGIQVVSSSTDIDSDSAASNQHKYHFQCLKDNITFLVQTCPVCLGLIDENDETPKQMATRLNCSDDILALLN